MSSSKQSNRTKGTQVAQKTHPTRNKVDKVVEMVVAFCLDDYTAQRCCHSLVKAAMIQINRV